MPALHAAAVKEGKSAQQWAKGAKSTADNGRTGKMDALSGNISMAIPYDHFNQIIPGGIVNIIPRNGYIISNHRPVNKDFYILPRADNCVNNYDAMDFLTICNR